jgi:hypothetical protein
MSLHAYLRDISAKYKPAGNKARKEMASGGAGHMRAHPGIVSTFQVGNEAERGQAKGRSPAPRVKAKSKIDKM